MASKTDNRGRLYLPTDIREEYGERYRIVELPTHVGLFPVSDDPLAAIEAEVGDALEGKDVDELKREARAKARREVDQERREAEAN